MRIRGKGMGKRILIGSIIAIAIIVLSSFSSVVGKVSSDEELVDVTIYEYKPDGTIEKSIVKMSHQKENELKIEIQETEDLEGQLLVYKKYDLIPQEITSEQLRLGMEEKAKRIGLDKDKLVRSSIDGTIKQRRGGFGNFFNGMNLYCEVHATLLFSLHLILGSSLFTIPLNSLVIYRLRELDIPVEYIPGFDIVNMCFSINGGSFSVKNGQLPDYHNILYFIRFLMIGFVGYILCLLPPLPIFSGISEISGYTACIFYGGNEFPPFP